MVKLSKKKKGKKRKTDLFLHRKFSSISNEFQLSTNERREVTARRAGSAFLYYYYYFVFI